MKKFYTLVLKEIKEVFIYKATLLFLVISCFLTGYSFYSAVDIYAKASVAAINNPLYAVGFEPVPGIFSPTWGGLFILLSLFFPFIIIPMIIKEKEQNTITILLQIPFSINEILLAKIISSLIVLLSVFFIIFPTVFIWIFFKGHVPWKELMVLNLGYFLYGAVVVSISLFSSTLFKNIGSASIFSILLITSSWLIDFGRDMNISSIITFISQYSITTILKKLENGIFSVSDLIYFLMIFFAFVFLARAFLDIKTNLKPILFAILTVIIGISAMLNINLNVDVSEIKRNSFSANILQLLHKISSIKIEIYMRENDSRVKDFKSSFLEKLMLVKRDVQVKFIKGKELNKNYGKFIYVINGKKGSTYSNSEEEIFPLIFKLAGIKYKKTDNKNYFKGYPLVVKKEKIKIILYIYYIIMPFLILIIPFLIKLSNKNRRSLK